jgi:flagellar assembly factor FliW
MSGPVAVVDRKAHHPRHHDVDREERMTDLGLAGPEQLPVFHFADGIPGFPQIQQWALVRLDEMGSVFDLHALDGSGTRFVTVPSFSFFPDYAPEINDDVATALELTDAADALVLLIVNVGADLPSSTANLAAPVIVNSAKLKGAQVVLDDLDLPIRAPLASPAVG